MPLFLPKIGGVYEKIAVVTDDLLRLIPKLDPFLKPSRVLYKTCAVVGNSGLSLFYKQGAEIDAHEAVIRFNAGPTKGFEDFVGRRTTVRFVNRLHFGFQESPKEIVLQQVTTPESFDKFLELKRELPSSRVFMVSPDFHAHVVSELKKPPTNGFYGALFALQRCKNVTLYGFFRAEEKHVPYHYFDTDEPVENQRSRDILETPLLMELVRHSGGRMRVAEPCLMPEDFGSLENGLIMSDIERILGMKNATRSSVVDDEDENEGERMENLPWSEQEVLYAKSRFCRTCPSGSYCSIGSSFPRSLPSMCRDAGSYHEFFPCTEKAARTSRIVVPLSATDRIFT